MTAAPSSRSGTAVAVQLGAMMFLQFFVWGAWYVTMGPFMNASGMSGSLIGWAYSVGPIAAIVSPFFLGMVADRFFPTERVLGTMHLLGGLALLAAPTAAGVSPQLFIIAVLVHMLLYMPTLGLTNTLAFHNLTNGEKQFPLVRVFGTIGWIVANWVVSFLALDTSAGMFYVAGASGLMLGAYSFFLPHTPPPAKGKAFSARDAVGADALVLMKDRSFAVFIICSFLICIPLAAYYAFAGQFAGAVGFERIAFTMSAGQISEIFFMLVMPLCFVRLGVKWMLLIGMGAWVARYGLFAGAWDSATGNHLMPMVLIGIILHGICYDFFFVTGFIYTDKKAPVHVRGSAQGFLVLVTQGLGMFIGAQVAGRLVDHYSTPAADGTTVIAWDKLWLAPCLFAAIVMVIFFLFFKDRVTATPAQVDRTPLGPDQSETAV